MKKIRRLKHGDFQITIFLKNGAKIGKCTGKRRRRQTSGFLNSYDFAYAGRDTVNQVGKIALGIINKATSDINKIAKERIDQVIRTGGAEVERIALKIIKGAIEEVYKTPFRLKLRKETVPENKTKNIQVNNKSYLNSLT